MGSLGMFVGINNYPGTRLDLAGCVNDAKDWSSLLAPSCDNIVMLLDKDATRANIVANMTEMLSRLKAGDWGYITFSGHGSFVPDESGDELDGRDECLVPYDYDNPILDDDIHELLMSRTPGSNLFVAADSCHSGTVSRLFNDMEETTARIRFMSPTVFLPQSRARQVEIVARRIKVPKERIAPGLVLLAGCADHEFSYDATNFKGPDGKPRANGAFTRAAIDALTGMRKQSGFTTWHSNIRKRLPSYQYPQSPKLNARAGEGSWRLPWVS